MKQDVREKLRKIKMLAMDVDGVLTDGGMIYDETGEVLKRFDAHDGYGLKILQEGGIRAAIITFNKSKVILARAKLLGIEDLTRGEADKLGALTAICEKRGLSFEEVAYVGDDFLDLPVLRRVGFSVAVANAVSELKREVDYITRRHGGRGAIREVCDLLLNAKKGKDRVLGVIPARYESRRFPGKALQPIDGIPMVVCTCENARRAGLDEVLVATDDRRILEACEAHGCRAVMTSRDCRNGLERSAEVARNVRADIVIDIQADEPFLPAEAIEILKMEMIANPLLQTATLAANCRDPRLLQDPNIVKVVTDASGRALYFSRSALPNRTDSTPGFLRHLGIYAFREEALRTYANRPPGELESLERLEQLRVLEHGESMHVFRFDTDCRAVNVPEDLDDPHADGNTQA